MGRAVPAYGNASIDHILLSYAFFAAGVAATLSITIAMCGLISGRKEPTTDDKENPDKTESESNDVVGENPNTTDKSQDKPSGGEELPLPPGSKLRGSQSTVLRSNSKNPALTTKNLRVTMSMSKAKPSMTDINIHHKKEKSEDSIWMKPIILGEKCRVPGNVAVVDEGDDRAIISVDGSIASTKFRNHSRQFTMRNNEFVEKINVDNSNNPSSS